MSQRQIDFIRHGMPEGGRCYRGSGVDDVLSEAGWSQMWQAVGEVAHWRQIVTSPMRRCREFAQALGQRHGLPVTVEKGFAEVGFGDWEGLAPDEIQDRQPKLWRDFHRDPVRCRPCGAEDLHDFGRRVALAFERLLHQPEAHDILVIAHAGVIRAVLGHVLQAAPEAWYRVQVDNAGISRFQQDQQGVRLIFHNRTAIQAFD